MRISDWSSDVCFRSVGALREGPAAGGFEECVDGVDGALCAEHLVAAAPQPQAQRDFLTLGDVCLILSDVVRNSAVSGKSVSARESPGARLLLNNNNSLYPPTPYTTLYSLLTSI